MIKPFPNALASKAKDTSLTKRFKEMQKWLVKKLEDLPCVFVRQIKYYS